MKDKLMKKETVFIPELILVGISDRTNNKNEANPETAKISSMIQRYFHQSLATNIPNRTKPGTTYCVYTDYESDEFGDYTYFVGEAVQSGTEVPEDLTKIIIPAQTYVKFTNGPGAMPDVCITAWKDIWSMSSDALGGQRTYGADFEIYDERAQNPHQVELDICIGIQSNAASL